MNDLADKLKIKVVFLGDCGVGKSSLIGRYARQEFDLFTRATIGVEYATRQAECLINGKAYHLEIQLWDTAGQQRYRSFTSAYFRNAMGVVIIYDMTKRQSFNAVSKWCELAKENLVEGYSSLLIGSKSDLNHLRVVALPEGLKAASENSIGFFEETSSLSQDPDEKRKIQAVMASFIESKEIMAILGIIGKIESDMYHNGEINRYSSQAFRESRISVGGQQERQHWGCC